MSADSVTVRITAELTEHDSQATGAVLVACARWWIGGGPEVRTAGHVTTLTIDADGWPTVAAAIAKARHTAGPGWSVSVTSTLPADRLLEHPTFD